MENAITAIQATAGAVFRALDWAGLVHHLPPEKLVLMLQKLCETRYFEEKAEELYTRGLVHGTMALFIGMGTSLLEIRKETMSGQMLATIFPQWGELTKTDSISGGSSNV